MFVVFMKKTLVEGFQNESVVEGCIAIDGVLGEGAFTPGVGAAHAVNVEVDVQIDEFATGNFVGMTHTEVFFAIVPGSDAKGLTAQDTEGGTGGRELEPAHIATVAVVLRMDVFGLVFRQRHGVFAQKG